MKKLVRSPINPAAQIVKRVTEINATKQQKGKPVKTKVKLSFHDSCFKISNDVYCLVEKNDIGVMTCCDFRVDSLEPFFTAPIDSRLLGIFRIRDLSHLRTKTVTRAESELKHQVCILPYKSGYVCIPLLHNDE